MLGDCISSLYEGSSRLQAPEVTEIISAISLERLHPYRQGLLNDREAVARYLWNSALSEAMYPLLQALEITFRNALHSNLSQRFSANGQDWYAPAIQLLHPPEVDEASKAIGRLTRAKKGITPGRVVAELSFGFWTTLLSRPYERRLWPALLPLVFPNIPSSQRTRSNVSLRFNGLRHLRNRVFHHEPVWNRPTLPNDHDTIIETIGWINPALAGIVARHDRFMLVHRTGPSVFLP